MAGLWNLSLTQRIDLNGKPYPGAKAYFYEAETLTPLIVYQNYDCSVSHPNPVAADGYGMFPAVYLKESDGFFRVRVTTSGGVILFDQATLPIIGPSGGGGGGGGGTPVDPNALWQTGDIKTRFATGVHPGWERCNGRTIGDATSGATGRANADTQALFEFLWAAVPNTILAVNGGRGASASADFTAHKTIQLPDFRGRAVFGLDDMGTSAAGRLLSALVATGSPTQLGSSGGDDQHVLTVPELPVVTPAGTISEIPPHVHGLSGNGGPLGRGSAEGGARDTQLMSPSGAASSPPINTGTAGGVTPTFTGTPFGGGAPHNNMPPFALASFYIKL
ncbi:hypothetical protein [Kaistia granuli]|uniref:hypothetical protein n=1 Tax=Kaistia granuli TaxID=363259 RepID=UPI00036AE00E|nr:hypothetical protein [Kaistia granuli]